MELDLSCWMRDTKGFIPPQLVGASLTFYRPPDDSPPQIFLFGGRRQLSDTRVMQNALYSLDMATLVWTRLYHGNDNGPVDPTVPAPRYFHSLDVYHDSLVLYGGMASSSSSGSSSNPELPPVLSDVHVFHVPTLTWRCLHTPTIPAAFMDSVPRYAHVSAICGSQLVVVGGQDATSSYIQEAGVFDLATCRWVGKQRFGSADEQRGMYRSVCVAADIDDLAEDDEDAEGEIVLYSNYNFQDVRRTLEVLTPALDPSDSAEYIYSDRTEDMSEDADVLKSPPGLRFPTGARVGDWLIVSGIYLANSVQDYSIWALNLKTLEWSPIDLKESSPLRQGAWSKAVLDTVENQFLVLGAKNASMVADYNKRIASFEQIVYIDLETFGIYRRPVPTLSETQVDMMLSSFDEGLGADLDVICEDGRRIRCSRRLLEERWTWFADERAKYNELAETIRPDSTLMPKDDGLIATLPLARLRNTVLHFPEPHPVVLAFLQWIYTFSLLTPLQMAPPVLSSLLIISKQYDIRLLQDAVVFRMHEALRPETAEGIAEVASICGCQGLLVRAQGMIPPRPSEGFSSEGMVRGGPAASGAGSSNGGANGRSRSGSGPGPAFLEGFATAADRSSGGGAAGSSSGVAPQNGPSDSSGSHVAVEATLPTSSAFPKISSMTPAMNRVKMPRRASDPPRPPPPTIVDCPPARQRTRSSDGGAVPIERLPEKPAFDSVMRSRQRSNSGGRSLLRSPLSMSSSSSSADADGEESESLRFAPIPPERSLSICSSQSSSSHHRNPDRLSRSTVASSAPSTPIDPSTPFIPFPADLKSAIGSDIERISLSSSTKASFRIRPVARSLAPSISSVESSHLGDSRRPSDVQFHSSTDTLSDGGPPSIPSIRRKGSFAVIASWTGRAKKSSSSSRPSYPIPSTPSSSSPPSFFDPGATPVAKTYQRSSAGVGAMRLPSTPNHSAQSLCLSVESTTPPPSFARRGAELDSPPANGEMRMYGRGGAGNQRASKASQASKKLASLSLASPPPERKLKKSDWRLEWPSIPGM